jgi:glycosyltransferase involved in cell wall biosynthesis
MNVKDFELDKYPMDVVVGQRIVLPPMVPVWDKLRQQGVKTVFEMDDDLFHVLPDNPQAWRVYNRPDVQSTMRACIESADLVTVSTGHLAKEVARECHVDPSKVEVIPNCVAPSMLALERPRRERVTVGWAGSSSHTPDLKAVASPLRRFLNEHKQVDFHLIGQDFRKMFGNGPNLRYTGWSKSIPDYWSKIDFDIGIAPLAHSIFNMSKSALKALEYGALGIPTIASDEAPYREAIIDGVTGFIVHRPDQWRKRLVQLVNDRAMREEMGAAAKAHVTKHYSIATGWKRWEHTYERLLANG